jgi:hypothetical protein
MMKSRKKRGAGLVARAGTKINKCIQGFYGKSRRKNATREA